MLRKTHEIIVYGSYELLLPDSEEIFAYTRTLGNEQLLVLCNFTDREINFNYSNELAEHRTAELLIANYPEADGEFASSFDLKPYEARVYQFKK